MGITRKILLVDDDKVSGSLLEKKLIKKSFDVTFVLSGKDALEQLKESTFDLILLDIMMPDMSGVEVLDELRKDYDRFELPVIMVTSKDQSSDIVDALKRQASDYVTKPVNFDVALARIETQLTVKSLYEESLNNKQISTINTMVATLNHEINNPLAIAVGNLSLPFDKLSQEKVDKALSALDRVAKITKKIDKISKGDMQEESYSENVNIFKLE